MVAGIEDDYEDVVAKAQKGLGLSSSQVAAEANLEVSDVKSARRGVYEKASARALAGALGLNATALTELAEGSIDPAVKSPENLYVFCTPFGNGWYVNAYIYRVPETSKALVIDTGTDPRPILDCISRHGLEVEAILITHTHGDHIACLGVLLDAFGGPPVYASAEAGLGKTSVRGGWEQSFASVTVTAVETPGHSLDGMSYLIEHDGSLLAMVGDAVFAGSIGGVGASEYLEALKLIRDRILSLPEGTILCPGHGPLTTVAYEKEHNPFFA